ncbi:MAG: response regulator [Planctomycetaceae bacterium]|nr:response regulator [Planctomycetaceae bacterium]MCP4462092.1 response regulator [Planctomycetaceae bacterium]
MAIVLVVDDTAVDRRLAGGLLEKSDNLEVVYANNGGEALDSIRQNAPDLVLTDLQMPDIDGLQLVTTITEEYPDIPVVLMTAHGSENAAAQALANGASCYVPKTELADELMPTVSQILSTADSDQRYKKLISCSTQSCFEFELPNDPDLIDPLIDLVQQVIASMDLFDWASRVRLGVALEHALGNAIYRGNLEIGRNSTDILDPQLVQERSRAEPYRDRHVFVSAQITREKAEFVIRDQGPGFDVSQVPDESDPDSFREGAGRGLVLIKAFMDSVHFNDKGNQISFTKHV